MPLAKARLRPPPSPRPNPHALLRATGAASVGGSVEAAGCSPSRRRMTRCEFSARLFWRVPPGRWRSARPRSSASFYDCEVADRNGLRRTPLGARSRRPPFSGGDGNSITTCRARATPSTYSFLPPGETDRHRIRTISARRLRPRRCSGRSCSCSACRRSSRQGLRSPRRHQTCRPGCPTLSPFRRFSVRK